MEDQVNKDVKKLLNLMTETGYPIVQNNGQRKFGPPPQWNGPPPQRGCEVFIGKLPREIYEDELVPVFSRVGKIYELRLMMDFSGSNRGYAFVTYTNKADACKAVKELNGYAIRPGRHIGVVKSVDNCRLFVGNIPKTKTKEEVLEELSKRVTGIVDVILYKNCFDRRLNRGFAFVEFSSHRAAAMARRSLVPGCIRLWDQDVQVDWAEPEPEIDDDQMMRHLEKREYESSHKEDEGIGSVCAGDSCCGSPTDSVGIGYPAVQKDNFFIPGKLEAMCKRFMCAPPAYDYHRYLDPAGKDIWIGSVKLPHVGLPLLQVPKCIGPMFTRPCFSMHQAQVEAADIALHYIKALRADLIQRTALRPVFQPIVQPVPINIPYEYTSMYPQQLAMPTYWRSA